MGPKRLRPAPRSSPKAQDAAGRRGGGAPRRRAPRPGAHPALSLSSMMGRCFLRSYTTTPPSRRPVARMCCTLRFQARHASSTRAPAPACARARGRPVSARRAHARTRRACQRLARAVRPARRGAAWRHQAPPAAEPARAAHAQWRAGIGGRRARAPRDHALVSAGAREPAGANTHRATPWLAQWGALVRNSGARARPGSARAAP